MTHPQVMTQQTLPTGPDPEAITNHIRSAWPDAAIASMEGATFFSLDPATHWPNFATLVWSDGFDQASALDRPGVFRLNIGVGRASFDRVRDASTDVDPTSFDHLFPHPVYARQRWVSILNPSHETFGRTVVPLLAEAHDLIAKRRRSRSAPN